MRTSTIIKLATDRKDWPHDILEFSDPAKVQTNVFRELRETGIRTKVKPPGSKNPNTALAAPKVLFLPKDWWERSAISRAGMCIHELVHYLGRRKHPVRWFTRYAQPWWLVILELQAMSASYHWSRRFDYLPASFDVATWAYNELLEDYGPAVRWLNKRKLSRVVREVFKRAV